MISVFVDTAPLIYLLEGVPALRNEVNRQIKAWIEDDAHIVTSVVSLMELLVHPKRSADSHLENRYRSLLRGILSAPYLGIDEQAACLAATYRSTHGIRALDSLQLAVAATAGCGIFYTNDKVLRRVGDIKVVLVKP